MTEGELVAGLWADGEPLHCSLDGCLVVEPGIYLDWLMTERSPVLRCVKGTVLMDIAGSPWPVQLRQGKAGMLRPGWLRLRAHGDATAYVRVEGRVA